MIDRGANVQPDQVETLVQYLAKNFGPKDATPPASAARLRNRFDVEYASVLWSSLMEMPAPSENLGRFTVDGTALQAISHS